MDAGLDHLSTCPTARIKRKYCEYLKARPVNLGWLIVIDDKSTRVNKSTSFNFDRSTQDKNLTVKKKTCSLFDLLTSQPIHHVQAENSRNFISFLFRFNFIPLYSYSCLITLRIDIWSDVIFFSGNQECSFSLKNYHFNQFYFFNTQLLDYNWSIQIRA